MNNKTTIVFKNSFFQYNFSTYRGGVIYSESDLTDLNVSFIDCEFEDNFLIEGKKKI